MRKFEARRNFLLLNDDGTIHYPFSRYLTREQINPHTREVISQALRIFCRLCMAKCIDLPRRALEGRCLTDLEINNLVSLCYRPLDEIEAFSDHKIVNILSAKAGTQPEKLPKAVQANTARKRLLDIAAYLDNYRKVILDPNIRAESTRAWLIEEYANTIATLRTKIRGTKETHHLQIKSLPVEKFQAIIRAIYVSPDKLFLNDSGEPSRTMYRDRAMALLAAEGLRTGSINNIQARDLKLISGHLMILDHREKRGRPSASHSHLKLGAEVSKVNSASETMISLWPFTLEAIDKYIKTERDAALTKTLANHSNGFLFLSEQGSPIEHRSSVTRMFNRLGKQLKAAGLLNVGDDAYFSNKKTYDFYGHVLRHSAAVYYCKEKGTSDATLDTMKTRFGWTASSKMPQLYAARALSDQANVDLAEFANMLQAEVATRWEAKKNGKGSVQE